MTKENQTMNKNAVDAVIELYYQRESEFTERDCGILSGFFNAAYRYRIDFPKNKRSRSDTSTHHSRITMTKCAK